MYDDWRGGVYPARGAKRHWLELYATRFDTVEVNSTFYRLAQAKSVAEWAKQTPDGFTFAVKASRYLTHVKRLADMTDPLERFYAPLEPLRAANKLGPVLWQLPASFRRDDDRLAGWLAALPAGLHAIEFRHPSWFVAEVMDALRVHQVALVIGDHPERPFQSWDATADWRFLRFHYGARGRDGNYSASELRDWAERIGQWRRGHDVYAYFNNDWRGFAPANAQLLRRHLNGA
jgi:uncharacterized protein YecE (DUF72 family)